MDDFTLYSITILFIASLVGVPWLFLFYLPKRRIEKDKNKTEEDRSKGIARKARFSDGVVAIIFIPLAVSSFFYGNSPYDYIWGILLLWIGVISLCRCVMSRQKFDPFMKEGLHRLVSLLEIASYILFFAIVIWGIITLIGFNYHGTNEGTAGNYYVCKQVIQLQPNDLQTYFGTFVGTTLKTRSGFTMGGEYVRMNTENGVCTRAYVYDKRQDPNCLNNIKDGVAYPYLGYDDLCYTTPQSVGQELPPQYSAPVQNTRQPSSETKQSYTLQQLQTEGATPIY